MLILLKDGGRFQSQIEIQSLVDAHELYKRGYARIFISCEGRQKSLIYLNIDLIDIENTLKYSGNSENSGNSGNSGGSA